MLGNNPKEKENRTNIALPSMSLIGKQKYLQLPLFNHLFPQCRQVKAFHDNMPWACWKILIMKGFPVFPVFFFFFICVRKLKGFGRVGFGGGRESPNFTCFPCRFGLGSLHVPAKIPRTRSLYMYLVQGMGNHNATSSFQGEVVTLGLYLSGKPPSYTGRLMFSLQFLADLTTP